MSGSWFVTTAVPDQVATPSQSLMVTYVDWFGNSRMAWASPTADGEYNFLSFATSQGKFLNGRILQPLYCRLAGICHLTNSIQYRGADGHRYFASLEMPSHASDTAGP